MIDPRTGLGRFREFTTTHTFLMEKLIKYCPSMTIEEILDLRDIQERFELYEQHKYDFIEMCKQNTKVENNVVITDLVDADVIFAGNRFVIHTLYPSANVFLWVTQAKKGKIMIAVGYSIINKSWEHDIGKIVAEYGGGGLQKVGTCQVDREEYEAIVSEIVTKLKEK
jgi:nanoRNase/pAp phosphatase (c-di-AMP/oligoRNAs hydrolase)